MENFNLAFYVCLLFYTIVIHLHNYVSLSCLLYEQQFWRLMGFFLDF